MSVITFSTQYPSYHSRKGESTNFVEKIWLSLISQGLISVSKAVELSKQTGIGNLNMNNIRKLDLPLKHHTVRAGNRWKAGDVFKPVIWGDNINPKSGRKGPYHSKQIQFAPDIEIKKVWNIEIKTIESRYRLNDKRVFRIVAFVNGKMLDENAESVERQDFDPKQFNLLAKNDGLEEQDFVDWFFPNPYKKNKFFPMKPFQGQIICWNQNIEY